MAGGSRAGSPAIARSTLGHDPLRLGRIAVDHQPARALGDVAPQDQHRRADGGAETEGEAPGIRLRNPGRVQQQHRDARAQGRSEPEAGVDAEVDVTAHPPRNQLVDRRIDGGVFTADPGAGQRPEQAEAAEAPGERRGRRRGEIEHQRDAEEPLASEPIGRVAKDQRAHHRSEQVDASGEAELGIGEAERVGTLEHPGQRAGQIALEAVEQPGDPERSDHQRVPTAPRETIEPGGDVGLDPALLGHARSLRKGNPSAAGATSGVRVRRTWTWTTWPPWPAVAASGGFFAGRANVPAAIKSTPNATGPHIPTAGTGAAATRLIVPVIGG